MVVRTQKKKERKEREIFHSFPIRNQRVKRERERGREKEIRVGKLEKQGRLRTQTVFGVAGHINL